MEVSGHIQAPSALAPSKGIRDSLDRRMGGSQNRSGQGNKKALYLSVIEPGRLARFEFTI